MKRVLKFFFKGLKWLLISLLAIIFLVLVAIYLPPVQDAVVSRVLTSLNTSSSDMHIDLKKLRLKFPLRLQVDSLQVNMPAMAIEAGSINLKIDILPLLAAKVNVANLDIDRTNVTIGSPDSLMYMRAQVATGNIKDASIALMTSKINISDIFLDNGNIELDIKPDTIAKPKEESAPLEWQLQLNKVVLSRITYGMQMLPTIDDLNVRLPMAKLLGAEISLKESTIFAQELSLDSVAATYIVPTPEYIATHPMLELPVDTTPSIPWTINALRLRLNNASALYATAGVTPSQGFDPAYIQANDINLAVDSFYNRGTEITVPITKFTATERCGINLNAQGLFAMDSTQMRLNDFRITTPVSLITADATMGLAPVNPPLSASLSATVGIDDLKALAPIGMYPLVSSIPPYTPLELGADISGSLDDLDISRLFARIDRHIYLSASGNIANYSDLNVATGNITLRGDIPDANFVKPALLDAKMQRDIKIPPLRLNGNVKLAHGIIDGTLKAVTGKGDIALDATWNNRKEGYDIDLNFNEFPLQHIMPSAAIANLSASITAKGEGLDFTSTKTEAQARIDLEHVAYNGSVYTDITLEALLAHGNANIEANSRNRNANFTLSANGNLNGDTLRWEFAGDLKRIDLHALALSDTTAEGSMQFTGDASFTPAVAATRRKPGRPMNLKANLNIADLYWHIPADAINANDINLTFSTDTTTSATLINHDLSIAFASPTPLDTVMRRFNLASLAINRDLSRRWLAIDTIERALPPFTLKMDAGTNNVLANYLVGSDIIFNSITARASNDSIIKLSAKATGIISGKTMVDTLSLGAVQRGEYLYYGLKMENRPGTFDEFAHVNLHGVLNANRIQAIFKQQNIGKETGFSLGLLASMATPDIVELRFVPYHPIIGYKDWEINKDNLISYNFVTRHLDANLDLHNSQSSLQLFTEHNPADSINKEDVVLRINDIKIADWLSISPFSPPLTGDLNADLRVSWQPPYLNGSGNVSLTQFKYGKERVGDFLLDLDIATNTTGTIRANTTLTVDGVKSITLAGNLNDSTAAHPFNLDMQMIHFPLSVVNPFLPKGTAKLNGTLNGTFDVSGSMNSPILNGNLDFDSTTVHIEMLGTTFHFSDAKIPVENNFVKLDKFKIFGINDNPLNINGTVDITEPSNTKIALNMLARNMQVVGSQKSRHSTVYGKAFIDLDAAIRGNIHMLNVDAVLDVLPGTNVTYVMADAAQTIASRGKTDMVKFVNFNDTLPKIATDSVAPPEAMLLNLDAKLTISNGTTINVDLDTQGKNKVQILSNGTVNFTMDYMDDQRLSGRINLNGGFVRYSIPVMGEKNFKFTEGSYVEFNGDVLNPILNIKAYDNVRANVAQNGANSRVVNFNVGLNVSGTLNTMNVAFDLECPDDISIANELKSMTAEQRASAAMNLLITNTYHVGGTETISSGSMGENALYSFLESQLNSLASNIKGVDISFGINQYDTSKSGQNTTAMNYSYQVSKSLFDDRFKIVVGGNYTTDADADENFAQNLIADISFEYMLNKPGTMYVRLFRHTGYESILEGEIVQTGVGFVYKKKLNTLRNLFRNLTKHISLPHRSAPPSPTPAQKAPVDTVTPILPSNENKASDETPHP